MADGVLCDPAALQAMCDRIKALEDDAANKLELCAQAPQPTQDNATSIRIGLPGSSTEAARCDHQHGTELLDAPAIPPISVLGTATQVNIAQAVDERTSETVTYWYRVLVDQPAGAGWGYVQTNNMVGFQRPRLYPHTYRYPSTTPQIDTDVTANQGNTGAAPRGPVMNHEISQWSRTRRGYLAYYRRDLAVRKYAELEVRYALA